MDLGRLSVSVNHVFLRVILSILLVYVRLHVTSLVTFSFDQHIDRSIWLVSLISCFIDDLTRFERKINSSTKRREMAHRGMARRSILCVATMNCIRTFIEMQHKLACSIYIFILTRLSVNHENE